MKPTLALDRAREIMMEFSRLTGLADSGKPPKRYLWTDAFAVCNFLELHRQTGEVEFRDLALRLVGQVHEILGRHREDDTRSGWISGLGEEQGAEHPTAGGLRIGKPLNERRPGDPYDEELEWDRDGQYYHYLTKWMQALNQATRATGDFRYNRWAVELAKTAQARFVTLSPAGDRKRMVWKMSIDLAYPLVPAMGHHDPLDGLITCSQLRATAAGDPEPPTDLDLGPEVEDLVGLCQGQDWATGDALGLGELLSDAYRAVELLAGGQRVLRDLPVPLLEASLSGLAVFNRGNPLNHPADYRLAFRELGLSIGLRAVEELSGFLKRHPGSLDLEHSLRARIENLAGYLPIREQVETFWLDRRNRASRSWTDHREINMVMLATSLAPGGFLRLDW